MSLSLNAKVTNSPVSARKSLYLSRFLCNAKPTPGSSAWYAQYTIYVQNPQVLFKRYVQNPHLLYLRYVQNPFITIRNMHKIPFSPTYPCSPFYFAYKICYRESSRFITIHIKLRRRWAICQINWKSCRLDYKVYTIEFKYCKCPPGASVEQKNELFDKTLNEAMDQIIRKGYGVKYIGSGKTIYQAAFAFLGRDDIILRMNIEPI